MARYIFVSGWRGDKNRVFANHMGLTPEEEDVVRKAVGAKGPCTVIHGDASGVDHVASLVFPCPFAVPAPWKTQHKSIAGPRRNKVMLDLAVDLMSLDHEVFVLAFPHPEYSRGTYDFIRKARALGLDVEVHDL